MSDRKFNFLMEMVVKMGVNEDFETRNNEFIQKMSEDEELKSLTNSWINRASKFEYSYHFTWMGRPIIQFPQDIIAIQEIIWKTQPDLIIETGIAHGGSLIFHASVLELIGNGGEVLGIDIDIREHNRQAIETHPMFKSIKLLQGSSTSPEIFRQVKTIADKKEKIMVILDSNHTHDHVLQELYLYSTLVKKDHYLLALDTVVEDLQPELSENRPWGPGNNPKTAVKEFLKNNDRFKPDYEIENKLLISVAPHGYLKCIKD